MKTVQQIEKSKLELGMRPVIFTKERINVKELPPAKKKRLMA